MKKSSSTPLFSLSSADIASDDEVDASLSSAGESGFSEPVKSVWSVFPGEVHLVTGMDGKSKESLYTFFTEHSFPIVSFEEASKIIEEERRNDDSEFMEGGIDPGRSVKTFLNLQEMALDESLITLCGIESILERGLKYLSTGEMRRTLMYRALSSSSPVLILDNPLDGLDTASRNTVLSLLRELPRKMLAIVLIAQDTALLEYASHVVYAGRDGIIFTGTVTDFLKTSIRQSSESAAFNDAEFESALLNSGIAQNEAGIKDKETKDHGTRNGSVKEELVKMNNVTVQWDERKVLESVFWTVHKGEHTLVQGTNGCGKTTLLELITGDNQQVYANDVYLFGSKRGSGETIWDIKAKLGIVSYKLHLEYRLVKGYTVEQVVVSGFYDSIGLYTVPLESELCTVRHWLELAGLHTLAGETFSSLSYGEQRAVLILRAVVKHPPLLILDEPCHSLDAKSRDFVLHLLEKIAQTGKTTLIHVTHDTTEILPCEKYLFQFKPGESPMYEVRSLK